MFLVFLSLIILVGLLIAGRTPTPYQSLGLLITGLLGLVNVLFNPTLRKELRKYNRILKSYWNSKDKKTDSLRDKSDGEDQMEIYRLVCWKCGYKWEMTVEEWEQAGRAEPN